MRSVIPDNSTGCAIEASGNVMEPIPSDTCAVTEAVKFTEALNPAVTIGNVVTLATSVAVTGLYVTILELPIA